MLQTHYIPVTVKIPSFRCIPQNEHELNALLKTDHPTMRKCHPSDEWMLFRCYFCVYFRCVPQNYHEPTAQLRTNHPTMRWFLSPEEGSFATIFFLRILFLSADAAPTFEPHVSHFLFVAASFVFRKITLLGNAPPLSRSRSVWNNVSILMKGLEMRRCDDTLEWSFVFRSLPRTRLSSSSGFGHNHYPLSKT